jgi:hypothetical protein
MPNGPGHPGPARDTYGRNGDELFWHDAGDEHHKHWRLRYVEILVDRYEAGDHDRQ